jgi:uncharacterized membrane protein YGL010W
MDPALVDEICRYIFMAWLGLLCVAAFFAAAYVNTRYNVQKDLEEKERFNKNKHD